VRWYRFGEEARAQPSPREWRPRRSR
jgi:hypothetical protein